MVEYPNYIISLNVIDANNIRLLTATGEIFKTDYLFRNFEPITKNNRFSYDFKYFDNNVGYCLGFSDSIYVTSDGGKNWNSISINKKNHVVYTLLNLQLINSDALLLNCYKFNKNVNDIIDLKNFSGIIIKKNENDFSEVFSYPQGTINKIYFFNNNIYYAVGNNNLILRSFDQGSSWTALTTKNNCNYYDVFFVDENTGYFIGSNNDEGFISITYDGCKTWT
ncbi:MAG: hypothetical protein NTU73_00320, partial [Ignavibacteriae bacterium]|nr:hypothetical protein [Ignavibacteriota bacterium]